jgi:hypothetical protein
VGSPRLAIPDQLRRRADRGQPVARARIGVDVSTQAAQVRAAERRIRETLTESSARRLARTIEAYWRGRGYLGIKCRIEHAVVECETRGDDYKPHAVFSVRSNIGPAGFPPRAP